MSGASLSLLLGFTIIFGIEAIQDAFASPEGDSDSGDDEVDAHIVLAFALIGLLFDFLSLASFRAWATGGNSGPDGGDDRGRR